MAVTIQIIKGEGFEARRNLILDKTTIRIGRGLDQDVRLTNDSVSRRHCALEKGDPEWMVVDEQSRNGVLVNGQRVRQQRTIRHSDVLQVGEVVLRVGIDRPLRDEERPFYMLSLQALVNLFAVASVVFVLIAAFTIAAFLYRSNEAVTLLSEPLSPEFGEEVTLNVFAGRAPTDITFSRIGELHGRKPDSLTLQRTVPEWDLTDVWSARVKGLEPRLFNGLDLDLPGGGRYLLSSYFFHRETYICPDAHDPYALLYLELEGWAGLGPRVGVEDLAAIRRFDLPHYVRSINVWPENVTPLEDMGYTGRQVVEFDQLRVYHPARGNPLGGRRTPALLAPFVGREQAREIPMEGRQYTFFYGGARYAATVRGSSRLLSRFEGGLDALAEAFFESLQVAPPSVARPTSPSADLTATIAETVERLRVLDRKRRLLTGVGSARYETLMDARALLLEAQQLPEPVAGEADLRRLYFETRNRVQDELVFNLGKVYEGRGRPSSPEGVQALKTIRDFLGEYPPLNMKRDDPGYPEWAWFHEDAMRRAPYNRQR